MECPNFTFIEIEGSLIDALNSIVIKILIEQL